MNHVDRESDYKTAAALFLVLKTDQPSSGVPGRGAGRAATQQQTTTTTTTTVTTLNIRQQEQLSHSSRALCVSAGLLAALSVTCRGGEAGVPPLLRQNYK